MREWKQKNSIPPVPSLSCFDRQRIDRAECRLEMSGSTLENILEEDRCANNPNNDISTGIPRIVERLYHHEEDASYAGGVASRSYVNKGGCDLVHLVKIQKHLCLIN
jgi:hypothetical protein